MKKFGLFLYYSFCILFLAFPHVVMSRSVLHLAELENIELAWKWGKILVISVLILSIIPTIKRKLPDWILIWAPIAAGVKLRLMWFAEIGPHLEMKYDFATVLDSAKAIPQPKEAIFTHWAFYPRILNVWDRFFGFTYESAVWFNIFVAALSIALVYIIGRLIFRRQRAAFMASMIFAVWPSYAMYAAITTNEHLAIFGQLLTTFFAVLCIRFCVKYRDDVGSVPYGKNQKPNSKSALIKYLAGPVLAILTGACAGFSDCFKQFTPLFIIAAAITAIVFWFIKKGNRKELLSIVIAVALAFGSASAFHELALKALERYMGQPVARSATAHFLYIGLNSKGGGMWSQEEGMKVYELAEKYDNDYEAVMDELSQILKEDMANNPDALEPTLLRKMEKDWPADSGLYEWINNEYDGGLPLGGWPDWDYWQCCSGGFYMGVMALIVLGAAVAFVKRHPYSMYMRLVLFGFGLLLMLSEAQGRYQVVLFPFFALLAAGALELFRDGNDSLIPKASEKHRKKEAKNV